MPLYFLNSTPFGGNPTEGEFAGVQRELSVLAVIM